MITKHNGITYDLEKMEEPTCGWCCMGSCKYVPYNNSKFVKKIHENIMTIENSNVRDQVICFCNDISQYLYYSKVGYLPNFHFSFDEDDAYFEWIFENFRFGFLFCVDSKDSGWCMVSKSDDGSYERYEGRYRGKETITFVFKYIMEHA